MSRKNHLAAYLFRTLTVRNVRLTRKAKISRLTRLRLLHYPKTYGMSCASSVEIEDDSHKAPYCLHVRTLTVRNVRLTRKSRISRLTRLRLLHYPRHLRVRCVCLLLKSTRMSRLKHLAAYMFEPLRYGMCAVSYTHLTLPTIYSV